MGTRRLRVAAQFAAVGAALAASLAACSSGSSGGGHHANEITVSSRSSQTTAAGELTFGRISESTAPGAPSTTAITSW